ncbi:MBL fold metallo-hydrolase [Robertmurraya massiliosenegalensis]|uniref:MBL fold metallo-hydrolase n=1 Tax=Robertmurraya TaxID=2837507 RepID=UPI0039A4CD87
MLVKRKSIRGEHEKVRYIQGLVSLHNVQLNVYCFEVDGLLVDTGAQVLLNEFKPFFAEADVEQVVITHFHEDHTGGAAYLQREYQLPIYQNEMTIGDCAKKADYPLYRKIFWGNRKPYEAIPIGETFTSRTATWDVIPTPGHAKDHLAFINRETGQLFSGDLYVTPKTKLALREESIPSIIQSIEKVLTYDFAELFCCHAGFIKDGRKVLTNKLHYLKELQGKIVTLQKEGLNEFEIQAKLFKKKYPLTLFSSGEWDSIHIIRSILQD